MVLSLVGSIQGCHFADRCAFAIDECRAHPIELTTGARPAHAVRCIRADELTGGPATTREQVA
jgi:ABC-type dipeptide/oligopeptide/nickel transport system ATPase component